MNYQTIILGKKENIAIMTLNRPERLSAISPQMAQELLSALNDVDEGVVTAFREKRQAAFQGR